MYDAPNAVEELKQPRKHPTAEKVKLSLSIDCFPMQCYVWRLPYSIIDIEPC